MMNPIKIARTRSIVASLVVAVAALSLPACSSSKPSGKVAGKVIYKGQAVTAGAVTFHDKGRGVAATAKLDPSGVFTFSQPLEYGTYAAMVTPPEGEPIDPRKGPSQGAKRAPIPHKTRDLTTSGLSFEVKEKSHEFTVVLTD